MCPDPFVIRTSKAKPHGLETSSLTVPLRVHSVADFTGHQPITVGIPLPKGWLKTSDRVAFVDPQGQLVSLQTLPLSRWGDGSIQWLLLDFVIPSAREGLAVWRLGRDLCNAQVAAPADSLRVSESADSQ